MKLRIMDARMLVLSLGFLMVNAGSALATTASLTGGTVASCAYSTFSADASGNLTVVCSGGGGSAPTTPQCTLTPSSSTLPVGGGPITLTATNCTNSPTSYTWGGGDGTASCSTALSTCSVNPTTSGSHGYSVIGNNVAGGGNTATATVTVANADQANCTVIDVTWPAGLNRLTEPTTPLQSLPANKMLSLRMKVTANMPARNAATNYSAGINKVMSISTQSCQMTAGVGPNCTRKGTPEAIIAYSRVSGLYKTCALPPVDDFVYFNIIHDVDSTGASSCKAGGSGCSFYFSW